MQVKLTVRMPVQIALKHENELQGVPDIVSRLIDWDMERIGRGPVVGDYVLMFASEEGRAELFKQITQVYITPGAEFPIEAMIVVNGASFFRTVHASWKQEKVLLQE